MADLESKILARELGQLGGYGARFVASFLRSVVHELAFDLPAPPAQVEGRAAAVLGAVGHAVPELPGLACVCGSGRANLNPTLVSLVVAPADGGSRVAVRAVAKEGAIKQDSARRAAERIKALLAGQPV